MEKQEIETWVSAKCIRLNGSVLDFTGMYEVSDLGRVRSLNYKRSGKVGVLKPDLFKNNDGTICYRVKLYKDDKKYTLSVHRLVLSSFKEGEYFSGAVCDHIDARTETSCCNHLSNLHWVTSQQNSSTEQCKALRSKALTNHPDLSKRVRVTDLATKESTVYPSASEAGRILGVNPRLPTACIRLCNGYYKKRQLYFEYV